MRPDFPLQKPEPALLPVPGPDSVAQAIPALGRLMALNIKNDEVERLAAPRVAWQDEE